MKPVTNNISPKMILLSEIACQRLDSSKTGQADEDYPVMRILFSLIKLELM